MQVLQIGEIKGCKKKNQGNGCWLFYRPPTLGINCQEKVKEEKGEEDREESVALVNDKNESDSAAIMNRSQTRVSHNS